jgi:hypothetical protein
MLGQWWANVQSAIPFSPTDLSGLQLWVDGDDPNGDGILPPDLSSISTWVDKSGNLNDLSQISGASQPIFVNGAGLLFNNSYMSSNSTSILLIRNSDYDIFIVANTAAGTTCLLSASANIGNFEFIIDATAPIPGAVQFIPVNPTAQFLVAGVNGDYDGINAVYEGVVQTTPSNSAYSVVNTTQGTPYTAASQQSPVNASLLLGTRGNMIIPFSGLVCEMTIFNRALSSLERTQMNSYFYSKWNIV